MAPCRAPPPHLLAASIAPHAARRLNRTEASHQPSLGRALALHPRSISLPPVPCRHRSRSRTFARPSVRSSIRPLTRFSLPLYPSSLFCTPFPARPISLSLSARSDHEPTFARLLGRAPSSFALFLPAPSRSPSRTMCAVCDALRSCILVYVVRSALCARPCPARRARARARSLRGLAHRGVRWMTPCTSCRPFIMTITGQRGSSLESG